MPLALAVYTQPSDQALACPGMLQALEGQGFDVCGLLLDRAGVKEKDISSGLHRKLGFSLIESSEEIVLRPDLDRASLRSALFEAITAFSPALVVTPYAHEDTPPYREVCVSAWEAMEEFSKSGEAPVWWMYSRGTLPAFNVSFEVPAESWGQISSCVGEEYLRRASVAGEACGRKIAEQVLEAQLFSDGVWRPGPRRFLSAEDPFPQASAAGPDMRDWLKTPLLLP